MWHQCRFGLDPLWSPVSSGFQNRGNSASTDSLSETVWFQKQQKKPSLITITRPGIFFLSSRYESLHTAHSLNLPITFHTNIRHMKDLSNNIFFKKLHKSVLVLVATLSVLVSVQALLTSLHAESISQRTLRQAILGPMTENHVNSPLITQVSCGGPVPTGPM